MKKEKAPVTNIGTVSLVAVFITLALVMFATLSLTGSLRDYNLSNRLVSHNTAYYQAANRATRQLRAVDELLASLDGTAAADYDRALQERFAALSAVRLTESEAGPQVSYTTTIDSDNELQVILTLHRDEASRRTAYRITRWQEVSTRTWTGDDTLEVM